MELKNSSNYDTSSWNRNYLSRSLIVTFWNCCLALFKSSLRSPEQSRYLRTCKIHGAKRGSHDRCFADVRAAICSCPSIEVIAVHAVNSGPNNPDYSRSSSFLHSVSLSSAVPPPYSRSFSSRPDELAMLFRVREKIHSFHRVRVTKGAVRGTSTKTIIYPNRIHCPHTRREHLQPT